MTSPAPSPEPTRPDDPAAAALFEALAAEHATIYGYGFVSAHSSPEINDLVAAAMKTHRAQREQAITMLDARKVAPPLPAVGYQLPMKVNTPTDAARLAVQMEEDMAVSWRALLEQAPTGSEGDEDRRFATSALTESAVLAARWRRVLKAWPITTAFPGGSD